MKMGLFQELEAWPMSYPISGEQEGETMGLFGLVDNDRELICLSLNAEEEIFSGNIMSFGEITVMEHFLILPMPLGL